MQGTYQLHSALFLALTDTNSRQLIMLAVLLLGLGALLALIPQMTRPRPPAKTD